MHIVMTPCMSYLGDGCGGGGRDVLPALIPTPEAHTSQPAPVWVPIVQP